MCEREEKIVQCRKGERERGRYNLEGLERGRGRERPSEFKRRRRYTHAKRCEREGKILYG